MNKRKNAIKEKIMVMQAYPSAKKYPITVSPYSIGLISKALGDLYDQIEHPEIKRVPPHEPQCTESQQHGSGEPC